MLEVHKFQSNDMTDVLRFMAESTSTLTISNQSGVLVLEFICSEGKITLRVLEPNINSIIYPIYHALDTLTITKNMHMDYQLEDLHKESAYSISMLGGSTRSFFTDEFFKDSVLLEHDDVVSSSYYQITNRNSGVVEAVIFDDKDFVILGCYFFQVTPELHNEIKRILDSIYYCLGVSND